MDLWDMWGRAGDQTQDPAPQQVLLVCAASIRGFWPLGEEPVFLLLQDPGTSGSPQVPSALPAQVSLLSFLGLGSPGPDRWPGWQDMAVLPWWPQLPLPGGCCSAGARQTVSALSKALSWLLLPRSGPCYGRSGPSPASEQWAVAAAPGQPALW